MNFLMLMGYHHFGLKIEEQDDRLGEISILEAVLTFCSKKLKRLLLYIISLAC